MEKEIVTHSSILAWRIPWTEEPGGLQSIGSQRVRQDLATKTFTSLTQSLPLLFQLGPCLQSSFGGSAVKNLSANAGDTGLIPGSERSLGGGNGSPLRYSCLENPMDRGARRAIIHGVTKNWTQLTTHMCHQSTPCSWKITVVWNLALPLWVIDLFQKPSDSHFS